jgi:hypothetical protein
MLSQSYLQKCEKLLDDFELTQARMLRLDLMSAENDFLIQMKQMRQFFNPMAAELKKFEFKTERDRLLLTKQIERLIVFLKEMDLHIVGFQTKSPPDENEVIFIFERQHLFKNIYRKHLHDFSSIIS